MAWQPQHYTESISTKGEFIRLPCSVLVSLLQVDADSFLKVFNTCLKVFLRHFLHFSVLILAPFSKTAKRNVRCTRSELTLCWALRDDSCGVHLQMIHASSEQLDSSACLQKLLESLLWSHHNTRDESARVPVQRIFVALAHSQGDVGAAISDSNNANLSHWTAAMQS